MVLTASFAEPCLFGLEHQTPTVEKVLVGSLARVLRGVNKNNRGSFVELLTKWQYIPPTNARCVHEVSGGRAH
jgi:hypothetical protein